MIKAWSIFFLLLFIGLLILAPTGCANPEPEVKDENGPDGDVYDDEGEGEALDAGAVIRAAAETYFAAVAGDNNIMPAAELKDMLDANPESVFLLDIRRAEDFAAGHIEGAYHSEWGQVGEIMDRLPANKPVVVACYTGQTAGQTVGALRMAGFTNAKSLQGGMNNGWAANSFPVEATGANAAADLSAVSGPAGEEETILWEAAQAFFAEVAAGNRGAILARDLYDALQANPNSFYILDIRAAAGGEHDYDAYRIENSVQCPWAEVGKKLDELPTIKPIVIASYSGQTAGQTRAVLRMLGFEVMSLQSGLRDGWAKSDLPVVTD